MDSGSKRLRVLVAEDVDVMRKTLIRSLQAHLQDRIDIVEARDGYEALLRFEPDKFDLIMTDWKMPGMDGLELLKKIRSVDADVPVIMLTAEATKVRVIEAIQAGVSDYLLKPFTQDALRRKIDRFVSSSAGT